MKLKRSTLQIVAAMLIVCTLFIGAVHGAAAGVFAFAAGGLVIKGFQNLPASAHLYEYTGVTLAEIFIPEVYMDIQPNDTVETSAFVQSGVAVTNNGLSAVAKSGTKKVECPLWNDLDATAEPNYSDDTDNEADVDGVATTSYDARNSYMNKAYGSADLAEEIGRATPGEGSPLTRVRDRFGSYWLRQFQKRIISTALGVMNQNVADDSSDMVHDVAAESTGAQNDASRIGSDQVIEAVFTMGDKFEALRAIAMHSIPYKTLVKQQLITFVRDAEGKLLYTEYLGLRVIVDDGLPVIAADTSGLKYVSILFGAGAIGYGEGAPKVPAAIGRNELEGNGGGNEFIIERKTWLIHPEGFDWTENTVTAPGHSPTEANLKLAANWARALDRKKVPLAFLITN